ncbi:MAG: helicase HerA domain-containing protein [Vulcanisaeta sp.]
MRIKLFISLVIALTTYLLDHRVYLIVINTLIPVILLKDLMQLKDQVRLFINGGEPVRSVRVDLSGITIDGIKIVGLRVMSVPFTIDNAFEDSLVRARALINLLARYHAIAIILPRGGYVVGVKEDEQRDFILELNRLGVEVRRISGFELINAMRMSIKRRRITRLPILLIFFAVLALASAYALALFPIMYTLYSVVDLPSKRNVVHLDYDFEVVQDPRALRMVDNTSLRAEALSFRSRLVRENVHLMLVVSINEELRERIKEVASRSYSRFLAFRHVKFFISYKDVENTIKRMQHGEDVYLIYLVSTAKFDPLLKWRLITSASITKILGLSRSDAWSMELNTALFTPFFIYPSYEEHGLAVIGKSINNTYVSWNFSKLSPHLLIAGPTGAGKTTLAMSMIYQVKRKLRDNVKVIVIDPHGHTKKLTKLLGIDYVDLGKTRIITRDLHMLVDAVRMMNPLLSIGPEGALLSMVLTKDIRIANVGDLIDALGELSNDLILREAYYNLYNSLASLIKYYDHENTVLEVSQMLDRDVIFVMNPILGEEVARYLSALILYSIVRRAMLECRNPPCPLKYIVVIDEAHSILGFPSEYRLLGITNPLEKMLREVRKFGVAIWLLLQPPLDVLSPGILENIGTVIILSGNSQYVSHVMSVMSGIDNDDALWLLGGNYKALVMRQGEPKSSRVSQLYVVKELLSNY